MEISDLCALKNQKTRLIGLDLGDKTIGVAISDLTWMIATPHLLIRRTALKKDLQQLQDLAVKNKVAAIIIGLPVNMNGTEGPQARKTRDFVETLEATLNLPVLFWDERLSTMAVTRTLLTADVSRKRRHDLVDKMAATFILQGVLDRLSSV